MKKQIVITAKPEASDIFAYKMYHAFCTTLGIFRIVFSLVFLVLWVAAYGKINWYESLSLLGFALLNPVATPLLFWRQSKRMAEKQKERRYILSADGIQITEEKISAKIGWRSLERIAWLKGELLLYTSPYEALILPKRMMRGQEAEVLEMIKGSEACGRLRKSLLK